MGKINLRNFTDIECCDMGSYEHQVPMAIKGRRREIDFCIADIVAALNAANIETTASCCGHGRLHGNILLADGRIIEIKNIKPKAVPPPPPPPPPERDITGDVFF
jgi:hypothetical protein